jgi:hypothetical protein
MHNELSSSLMRCRYKFILDMSHSLPQRFKVGPKSENKTVWHACRITHKYEELMTIKRSARGKGNVVGL